MADVFLIAIIVAFMAANASSMGELLNLRAQFEVGFLFFPWILRFFNSFYTTNDKKKLRIKTFIIQFHLTICNARYGTILNKDVIL